MSYREGTQDRSGLPIESRGGWTTMTRDSSGPEVQLFDDGDNEQSDPVTYGIAYTFIAIGGIMILSAIASRVRRLWIRPRVPVVPAPETEPPTPRSVWE